MPTPNLALVPLASAQSQKHVTVNEAFARIDAATQLAVLAASQGWLFLSPRDGWRVWVIDVGQTLHFDGAIWSSSRPAQLGINASADATNRLTVASEAILFNHDGSSIQTKLNKANDSDTASVLFQSGFTGHAEIGLTGGTDLQFKTSPDGSTFTDALTLDGATGHANLPAGATISGVEVHPDMILNVLPDQGRFGGEGANASIRAPNFIDPVYLGTFNDSTLSGYAQFFHNNATYGGNAAPLDPEIDALLALTRPSIDRRFGAEWWAIKVSKGAGTGGVSTVNGVTRHLAMRTIFAPTPRAFTMGIFVRALSGSAFIDQRDTIRFLRWEVDETGNESAGVIEPSDGWVFIQRQMTFNAGGYSSEVFQLDLESAGDEALIALPRLVVGHVHLDPYLRGPLPNNRFFG